HSASRFARNQSSLPRRGPADGRSDFARLIRAYHGPVAANADARHRRRRSIDGPQPLRPTRGRSVQTQYEEPAQGQHVRSTGTSKTSVPYSVLPLPPLPGLSSMQQPGAGGGANEAGVTAE